jgi:hypothetical protein
VIEELLAFSIVHIKRPGILGRNEIESTVNRDALRLFRR